MNTLFGQTVFESGARAYVWEDVLLSAQLRGEWAALESQARAGLACLQRLAAEGGSLDEQAIDAAAKEFRYENDLISAQETSVWLKRWGLSVKQWMDYFRRESMRAHWARQLDETLTRFPVTDAAVAACLKAEAVCAGSLTRFAEELAARAAARVAIQAGQTGQREASAGPGDNCGVALAASQLDFNAAAWPGLTAAAFREKAAHLVALENEFKLYRQGLLTTGALREQIKLHGLDWITVSAEAVVFPTEAEAREAVMCVRVDGMRLAEVARDAQRPLNQGVFYLDEMEANVREIFLALGSGELSDPVKLDNAYALYLIVEKTAPNEGDPQIRRRAATALLKSAITRDVNQFVQWRYPHKRVSQAGEQA